MPTVAISAVALRVEFSADVLSESAVQAGYGTTAWSELAAIRQRSLSSYSARVTSLQMVCNVSITPTPVVATASTVAA